DFTRTHAGSISVIDIHGEGENARHRMIRGLPFVGVTLEERDGTETIDLMIGDNLDAHVTHMIPSPSKVFVDKAPTGHGDKVEIEAGDGTVTSVCADRAA